MRASTPFLLTLSLSATLALVSCAGEPASEVTPSDPVPTQGAPTPDSAVTSIATGLDAPWSVTFHESTALISERDSARILELNDDGTTRELAVIAGVQPGGEGGLLGIAVHAGYLYAYFTAANENRIERFALTGASEAITLGEPETVIDGIPSARNHNGGRIAFGPDGMLYVTAGDAGNRSSAQVLDSLAGKILRVAPDGRVPDDNPFDGSYVYSYGHRNPQGLAWDHNGTLYSSEFGQDTWDELNVIEPGGNYGWPDTEGITGLADYVDPVQQWEPASASPSGIAISEGRIWIANLRGERLREVPLDDLATMTEHWIGEYGRLRDVIVAPDDALWIVTNNTDGRGDPESDDDRILRFDPGA